MAQLNGTTVLDCDGHLIESIPEMTEFMEPYLKQAVLHPSRNRQGLFPSLDGYHFPHRPDPDQEEGRPRVLASDERTGSAEDVVAFLDKTGMEHTVLYPSEGLSVGNIQLIEYAVDVCRAYNDYVAYKYRAINPRLHPVALIPTQDVGEAVTELRRAVKELGLCGAMFPSTGLPLHLGHEHYWPIYKEAADLGAVLGVHGGVYREFGIDTFTNQMGARLLHHPVPLMVGFVAMVYHGVFDQFPILKMAFIEGGAAWTGWIFDKMVRDGKYFSGARRRLPDIIAGGQVLIGCEGDDESLGYLAKRLGVEAFAYASDYPHEVDLPGAQEMIEETLTREDLTHDEKAAVLGGNYRRFFGL